MSLWSATDANTGAPKFSVASGLGVSSNGLTTYANTQSGQFKSGLAVGTFGVSAAERANTSGEASKVPHAGWNLRKAGTGPVTSISVAGGNINYTANGYLDISGGGLETAANASFTVNTVSNTISTITINSGGYGYVVAPTVRAANATSVNSATFTVTVGGRSGRIQYETLVATGSMNSGTEDDTVFPQ